MKTISSNIENEIVINKSRFICKIYKVYNEEEVLDILNNIKKEYKDATHYCYSYIIDNTKRFNDDGEPGGTAGMPILNVLESNNLNYVLALVVRYFGGIKLGAGGLVRAYTNSVVETLNNASFKEIKKGINITINFAYDKVKIIDNILKNINVKNKEFNELITYNFDINIEDYNNIKEILNQNISDISIKEDIFIEE